MTKHPDQPTTDRDAIIDTVTRVAWYTDQHRWEDLPDLFAEEVILDWTSLTGEEPATVAPDDIVARWRAAIGGLDATQHLICNHLVEVHGDAATSTAQFVATHRLDNPHGDHLWTLGGHYQWELARREGRWLITAMTMTATWATGNQQIMTLATAASGSADNTPAALARRFLTGLDTMDIDAALAVFADDAVQEMPFSPPGFPRRLDGIDALRTQYGGLPDAYRSMRFHIDDVIETATNATIRYHGEIELADGGRYDNTYVGIFEVADGRIQRYTEYFDPTVLTAAFNPDAMGDTFTLDDNDRR